MNLKWEERPRAGLPLELAQLHWASAPGERLVVEVATGSEGPSWGPDAIADVITGGGFAVNRLAERSGRLVVTATRIRSLPDTVGRAMRLLVCGLNPSLYAADRGVGYARPGNRFWPAALEAGILTRAHDPLHALTAHGVGMTDLVKRATPRADMLSADEYRAGAARVERLIQWLRPRVVCFVGLDGWRSAVDRRAEPGLQPTPFGGRPTYVMPSTSGLNAHSSRADLVRHLTAAGCAAE